MVSGIALAAHFALWMESLFHTTIAISVTLVSTHPLIVAGIVYFARGERPLNIQLLGAFTAMLGIPILTGFSRFSTANGLYGPLLALGGAVTGGVYFAIGRIMRPHIGLWSYTLPVYGVATAFLLLSTEAAGLNLVHYPLKTWVFFILLAVIPMMGGHTLLNYSMRYYRGIAVASVTLGEPVLASIWAYMLYAETIGFTSLAGMVLTLAGIAMIILGESRAFY